MTNERNFTRGPRIRSGGQTGVDRAALDAAVLTGRPYEGWCPKGGWAEDFLRPPGLLTKYPHLMEIPSESPEHEPSGLYATVRPQSYLCRTQNIALEVPISQLNAQGNMESHTASSTTLIMEPSLTSNSMISRLGEAPASSGPNRALSLADWSRNRRAECGRKALSYVDIR
jgi:hypothetical protein